MIKKKVIVTEKIEFEVDQFCEQKNNPSIFPKSQQGHFQARERYEGNLNLREASQNIVFTSLSFVLKFQVFFVNIKKTKFLPVQFF